MRGYYFYLHWLSPLINRNYSEYQINPSTFILICLRRLDLLISFGARAEYESMRGARAS
jgi:hypothetical protein